MYKLIIADFDGTSVCKDLVITQELRLAVENFTNKGGVFTFATGRMLDSILPYAKSLNLDGYISSFQGALVSDIKTAKDFYRIDIDTNTAYLLAQYIENNNWYYHVYTKNEFLVEKSTEYGLDYCAFTKSKMKILEEKPSAYIKNNNLRPLKMMIIEQEDHINIISKKIEAKFNDQISTTVSQANFIELINKRANKGVSVQYIANKLQIKLDEVICVGDSFNDIEMLKVAGLAVAVHNAPAAVKQYADVIAPSCKDNGLAYIIKKHGLNEPI